MISFESKYEQVAHGYRTSQILSGKLLYFALVLAWYQGKRYDATDMHIRAIHMQIQLELLADCLDVPEAFLIVGAGTSNPNLDLMFDQSVGKFS